ncbi:MAG: hypothetical protein J7507_02525 [Pseudoxanthomonas sp.]|nr:hypothetical protein [Pseudoxanthomonas sp.]
MRRLLELTLLGVACCAMQPLAAQEEAQPDGRIRVVPAENVKIDYAQVLRVEPVYQTLRATRSEERCEPLPPAPEKPAERKQEPGALSRMWDSVKGAFTGEAADPAPTPPATTAAKRENCRIVQVDRQFQRPIAYDVDYVYKGTKYRSRLADDPGNRLRVRVAVTPWEAEAPPLPPP